ncbi:MAG: hypothetical protein HQK65_17130 [Desulfamplus sp.]|nr:hypothetical protein [Desulfamplus sp.]
MQRFTLPDAKRLNPGFHRKLMEPGHLRAGGKWVNYFCAIPNRENKPLPKRRTGKEQEQRGHHFAPYADDLMLLVKSKRAANRVMESFKRNESEDSRI